MKSKVTLHCIHISPAQSSKHLEVGEIVYDGLKTNSLHYSCSRKFTQTGMESFDQRLGSEMAAIIQISEFPKDNWHSIAGASIGSATICFSCFLCPYVLGFFYLERDCSISFCCFNPGLHSKSY